MATDRTPLDLIQPLIDYQARSGRQVTFVWPAKLDSLNHTVIYAVHPTEPEFETDEPLLEVEGRQLYYAWRAAELIIEVSTRYAPQWGPVFYLAHRSEHPASAGAG